METINKPWLELSTQCNMDSPDYGWRTVSNNSRPTPDLNRKEILCYYIIQDCNMSGVYHRVFTWYKNDNKRYFQLKNKITWDFDVEFVELNNDEIFINKYGNKYKVLVKDSFVKILELLDE
jgi:hypothetical protein